MTPALEKNLLIFIKILTLVLVGAGIYFFITHFWPFLARLIGAGIKAVLPFLIAYLFASLLDPPITFLEQRLHLSRTWGTLFALLLFIAIIGGLLFLLISNLIRELVQLSQALASASQDLEIWNLNLLVERFQSFLLNLHLPQNIIQEAVRNLWQVVDFTKNIVGIILTQLFRFIASLPRYFILLIITLVGSFFFARDYHLIKTNMIRFIPAPWQAPFKRVSGGLFKAFHGYLKAQLFLISLTGLESLVGLSILGVSYAHILALVAAFVDLLPILGPGSLYIPWALWMLFSGKIRLGIGLLILYGIIVVVRQLLEPKVVGQSLGLHPLTTLITLYFGFSLLGLWGLILGPALVIAYKAFFEEKKAGI
ncbi:MAG: sporulation integral membrane protein YtvI [Firmicutes bacterium]|nr:sporulation integral membrane protein YtvI [Bacillota bacterium]